MLEVGIASKFIKMKRDDLGIYLVVSVSFFLHECSSMRKAINIDCSI